MGLRLLRKRCTVTSVYCNSKSLFSTANVSYGNAAKFCPAFSAGRKETVEKLWQEFFSDPSQWWDNRPGKVNARYPDFKHHHTEKGLWVVDIANPLWVEVKLAAMGPETVKVHVFSWNKMLVRYLKAGKHGKTIELLRKMIRTGVNPDKFTFVPALNACSSLQDLEEGRRIHSHIIENNFESDLYVGNSLVDMYAKCGSIEDACKVFHRMPVRDLVSWNAMIMGYVKCGQGQKALELYQQMSVEGVRPDPVTFVGVLNACTSVGALDEGRHIHKNVTQSACEPHIVLHNCLVDMYIKCGSIEEAQRVFEQMPTPDVVTWSSMILGYCKCGQEQKALELYRQMVVDGVEPDPITFLGVLNACASLAALEEGRVVHNEIRERGFESVVKVSNSLINMYCKCGSMEDSRRVFNNMQVWNVVACSAMILGYVKSGENHMALELFRQMEREGPEPNSVTFVGVLNACAGVMALEDGRRVHKQVIQRGWESNMFLASSLVDMYAKCGSINDAKKVFTKMSSRSVVSWNAMLAGYAMHGHAKEAVEHFEEMCQEGIEMDKITFVSLLSACSHGGLVDEGLHLFECMCNIYNISPTAQHHTCLIDLLGRAGYLHEAEDLVKKISCERNLDAWKSLLGACQMHGNVEMGEWLTKQVLKLESGNSAGYVMLSNIYANTGYCTSGHREETQG